MTVAYEEQAQAVRTTASALDGWAASLTTASDRLAPALGWRGPAADVAAEAVQELRARARVLAERPEHAADALRRCSAELEEAASLQRRAAALTGDDALRLELEAADAARSALCRAAAALQELQPTVPAHPPGWRGQLLGFGRGAWTALRDTFDLVQRTSPARAVVQPVTAFRDLWDLDRGLLDAALHPIETAQALAGVDQLRDGAYGEWLGGLVAGAALPGGRAGRLEGLGSRAAVRLVDRGGPVVVRVGVRVPRGYPAHIRDLTPKRRRHILDGDETGGGHRAGTGRPTKTEFPATWSDDTVIERVMQTAMRPEHVQFGRNGNLEARARFDGVSVKVVVSPDGRVITAHPDPGGPGVVRNPRAS